MTLRSKIIKDLLMCRIILCSLLIQSIKTQGTNVERETHYNKRLLIKFLILLKEMDQSMVCGQLQLIKSSTNKNICQIACIK